MVRRFGLFLGAELTGRLDNNDRRTDIHPLDLDHRLQDMSGRSLFLVVPVRCCMHAKSKISLPMITSTHDYKYP